MPFKLSTFRKCTARLPIPGTGEEYRPVWRPINGAMLDVLDACASQRQAAASLVTHLLIDGELVVVDPEIWTRKSEDFAAQVVAGIFSTIDFTNPDRPKTVYCGDIKGERQMELWQLESAFKDRTDITLAKATPDGDIEEEVVKIYHFSPFDQMGNGEVVFKKVLEAAEDEDNPVPVVTRQLLILGVYSKDFTLKGEPFILKPKVESIQNLPPAVQGKIARELCAPAMAFLTSRVQDNEARPAKEGAEQAAGDEAQASPPATAEVSAGEAAAA